MTAFKERPARVPIRLSAELKVDGRTLTATTRNLSTGGVCLELERVMAEGALVQLTLFVVEDEIEAEGARALELSGTVQWAAEADHGHAIGIKFGDLTAAQAAALGNALRALGVA